MVDVFGYEGSTDRKRQCADCLEPIGNNEPYRQEMGNLFTCIAGV
jgi:hypothetical protein